MVPVVPEVPADRAADKAAGVPDKAAEVPDRAAEVPDKGVEAPAEAAVEAFEVPEVLDCFPYSSFFAFPPLGSAFKCYVLGVRSHARKHHTLLVNAINSKHKFTKLFAINKIFIAFFTTFAIFC